MPTLAQLSGSSTANPSIVTIQTNNPVVEPLDGPTSVDDVMDRFPPEVYQQGRDTHLYRYLSALGGDSGAGLIKNMTFSIRLYLEAEGMFFHALDQFFAGQFNFNRLASETYYFDTSGGLTPEEWNVVLLADQSYKQRIIEYFTATRHGNSPEGMRVMGQAGTGIECDLIENYKWIFDQLSDDPLGLVPQGYTASTSEFILIPKFLNLSTDIYDEGFEQMLTWTPNITPASFTTTRPATGSAASASGRTYSTSARTMLNPDVERNAIDLFDQLSSVGTIATILPVNSQFLNVPIAGIPFASSTRLNVSRFVTGQAGVPWPAVNATGNNFIQAGFENEAGYYYGSQRDLPVVFHTIESIHAYTDAALGDPTYGTDAFYDTSSGFAPFQQFESEFVGNYSAMLTAIFPFLLNQNPSNDYSASEALAAQNTPLAMEGRAYPPTELSPNDVLVNGIYPLSYFSLPGVDPIQYPDSFWWGSKARFAAVGVSDTTYLSLTSGGLQTSEVLEIDLGRIREINYLNLDVLTAPINITIEYDNISTPERDAIWLSVSPVASTPFDSTITYNPDSRTAWQNAEFNFTDVKGEMIHTRYLRITFTRRDEPWPTSQTNPFQWPVLVKHLRTGRYVADYLDTVGPLLSQDTPENLTPVTLVTVDNNVTREVRQQFAFPEDCQRGDITPNILGFGVLVQTQTTSEQTLASPDIQFQWSLWDVTNPAAPVQLRNGVETQVVTTGLSWLDFYLPEDLIVVGSIDSIYELHVNSLTALTLNEVFTNSPSSLSTVTAPGTLHFTHGSTSVATSVDTRGTVSIGSFITNSDIPDQVYTVNGVSSSTITLNTPYTGITDTTATGLVVYPFSSYNEVSDAYVLDGSRNLIMRVWSDIADSGRDILGNAYRYGSRREIASHVLDNTKAGWMSNPVPTPNAVEALYFDVRSIDDDNNPQYALIDAIRVSPRTPGVQMNVYYSQQGLIGMAPATETEWDYLLWQPVQASYTLRRGEVIQLPQQMRAAFVKLEFTNLNPQPFRVPTFPSLPPKSYRLFPQWVIDQFDNTPLDLFVQKQSAVQTQILQPLTDPIYEYQNNQRHELALLALGISADSQAVASGLTSTAGASSVDATTAGQIFLNTPAQYQNTQLISVDQNTVLGKVVVSRYNPTLFTDPIEGTPAAAAAALVRGDAPFVSTTNDRISQAYQGITQTGLRFNQVARHTYDVEQANFSKKAYFVGIQEVQFLRNDHTQAYDSPLIEDNLFDDQMMIEDTWARDASTSIPDGATLYVSYSVNPSVLDEQVLLVGFVPAELATVGGPAYSVSVFSQPNKQGIQYFQGQDYDLVFGYDNLGNRTTSIVRSSLGNRLAVPLQAIIYVDAGTVIGVGVIPSPPTIDAGVVKGKGIASDPFEGPFVPNFGSGTFGGGNFGNLTKVVTDTGSAGGHAVPGSADNVTHTDSHTVVSVGKPSGTDTYTP